VIGILITTVGISLLTLGLVGASVEVQRQLFSALVQQQVSSFAQQLPEIIRPERPAGEAEPAFGSAQILAGLFENLVSNPLWLLLAIAGVVLIYTGLYVTQRQRLRR
jgi:ABC-type multidrug transport system permease subunit